MGRVMVGVITVGLALGLVAPAPVGAQSDAPGSPQPVDAAAVVTTALGGLRALDAWSFEDRSTTTIWSGLETVTTGTIVNGTPWRHAMDITTEGETGWRRVVVGKNGWQNLYDGDFHTMKDLGIPVPGPADPLPFEQLLGDLPGAGLALTDLGLATHDGVEVRHYQGHTPDWEEDVPAPGASPAPGPSGGPSPSGAPSPSGSSPSDPTSPSASSSPSATGSPSASTAAPSPSSSPAPVEATTFRAALDLWVDAQDGHLVAFDVHSVAPLTVPGTSIRTDYSLDESVTIGGVADPAGAVEKPSLDAVTYATTDGADPALASTVLGAFANLDSLESYRASVDFLGNGYTGVTELTVQNGRKPAVEVWNTFRGERTNGLRVVARKRWTSAVDDPRWRPIKKGDPLPCAAPCTVASLSDVSGSIAASAETYRLVSDAEELDGTPAIHLRSTAGREIAGFGVFPGTADLWIAKDGGYLLKDVFDGTAQLRTTTISGVDDPANSLTAPKR